MQEGCLAENLYQTEEKERMIGEDSTRRGKAEGRSKEIQPGAREELSDQNAKDIV